MGEGVSGRGGERWGKERRREKRGTGEERRRGGTEMPG